MTEELRKEENLEKISPQPEGGIPEVDKIGIQESKERQEGLSALERIQNVKESYKQEAINIAISEGESIGNIRELPTELTKRMNVEIAIVEAEYTVDGVCFAYCQFGEIVKDYKAGRRVEVEGFGPYLKDYFSQLFESDYSGVTLKPEDEMGMRIMLAVLDEMPDAHVVSLFDEYNFGEAKAGPSGGPKEMGRNPRKHDPFLYEHNKSTLEKPGRLISGSDKPQYVDTVEGTVFKDIRGEWQEVPNKIRLKVNPAIDYEDKGRLINESQTLRDEFRKWVEGVLRSKGAIKDDAKEGAESDYVLVSETDKISDAKRLVKKFQEQGQIEGDPESDEGEIWYQGDLTICEDPRYLRIKLRDSEGHWECAALDASGYFDNPEENRESDNLNANITSLVILPDDPENSNFKVQRAEVWELLHALKDENGQPVFESTQVHDIFVEKGADPEKAVDLVKKKLKSVGA